MLRLHGAANRPHQEEVERKINEWNNQEHGRDPYLCEVREAVLTLVEGILADEIASHKIIDRNRCAIEVPVDRYGIEIGQADKILEVCHRKIVGT